MCECLREEQRGGPSQPKEEKRHLPKLGPKDTELSGPILFLSNVTPPPASPLLLGAHFQGVANQVGIILL